MCGSYPSISLLRCTFRNLRLAQSKHQDTNQTFINGHIAFLANHFLINLNYWTVGGLIYHGSGSNCKSLLSSESCVCICTITCKSEYIDSRIVSQTTANLLVCIRLSMINAVEDKLGGQQGFACE